LGPVLALYGNLLKKYLMIMMEAKELSNYLLNDDPFELHGRPLFDWNIFDQLFLKLKSLGIVQKKSDIYLMKERLTNFISIDKGCIMLDHPKECIKLVEYDYSKLTISMD
jgi:hypothetical protein